MPEQVSVTTLVHPYGSSTGTEPWYKRGRGSVTVMLDDRRSWGVPRFQRILDVEGGTKKTNGRIKWKPGSSRTRQMVAATAVKTR